MITLTIVNRKTKKETKHKLTSDSFTMGRSDRNDVHLDSSTVSRQHAQIECVNGDYFLIDLDSGNGTYLNQRKLKPQEKTPLHNLDTIRIEEFEIKPTFAEQMVTSFDDDTDSGIIEIKMIKKVLSALEVEQFPSFEMITEPNQGHKIHFTDEFEELVLGRDESNNFPIRSHVISRRHAVCHKKWGGVTITDLKSKNGTYVGNEKIKEHILKDGDIISMGDIKILFRNPHQIDMEALSKEYEQKAKDQEKQQQAMLQHKQEKESDTSRAASEQAKLSLDFDDDAQNSDEEREESTHHEEQEVSQKEKNQQNTQEDAEEDLEKELETDEEEHEKEDEIKKLEQEKSVQTKTNVTNPFSHFSFLEIMMMLGGLTILVITLFILYSILF